MLLSTHSSQDISGDSQQNVWIHKLPTIKPRMAPSQFSGTPRAVDELYGSILWLIVAKHSPQNGENNKNLLNLTILLKLE